MSQAHYLRCEMFKCHAQSVCRVYPPNWTGGKHSRLMCKRCLDQFLDQLDAFGKQEPSAITWCWDSGTRWCVRCDWPAELCADWTATEHRVMWASHRRRTLEAPDPFRALST